MSNAKWIERSYYRNIEMGYEIFTPLKNPYYTTKDEYIARLRFFKNLKRKKLKGLTNK